MIFVGSNFCFPGKFSIKGIIIHGNKVKSRAVLPCTSISREKPSILKITIRFQVSNTL